MWSLLDHVVPALSGLPIAGVAASPGEHVDRESGSSGRGSDPRCDCCDWVLLGYARDARRGSRGSDGAYGRDAAPGRANGTDRRGHVARGDRRANNPPSNGAKGGDQTGQTTRGDLRSTGGLKPGRGERTVVGQLTTS